MTKARQLADLGNAYDDGALSHRNLIINGAMQVAQRGTSATTPSGANYNTVDRFKPNLTRLDELVLTESQDADAPDGFSNSFKISVGTAESVIGADEYGFLTYTIEAQDLQQLNYGSASAKKITLSFWVKSSVTGTYGISFFQSDATRVITSTYTINTASTWEYKTITIDGDPSGTINNDNGGGLQIWFAWGAGSNYTSVESTSWTSYADNKGFYGHAANTLLTTTNATWQITGVQLEVGDTATPFEHRSYGDELARCQRYYEESDRGGFNHLGVVPTTTSNREVPIQFLVRKRANPSITFDTSGLSYYHFNTATRNTANSISASGICLDGFFSIATTSQARTAGDVVACDGMHYKADAEL